MNHRAVARRSLELLVVAAVLSPAVRDRDDFPLSTYPMYAFVRDRIAAFGTAHGIGPDGDRVDLSMEEIAGTDDPLVAVDRVRDAIDGGGAADLCRRILARTRSSVTAVVVVTERHDVIAAALGEPSIVEAQEHARCSRS